MHDPQLVEQEQQRIERELLQGKPEGLIRVPHAEYLSNINFEFNSKVEKINNSKPYYQGRLKFIKRKKR